MDICGFTPISEHYKNNDDPEGLVELVNEFLDAMTKIILANGGTIDKYMGDCIMAFWNAPLPCKNHAEMAVKSAIEIENKTNELKESTKNVVFLILMLVLALTPGLALLVTWVVNPDLTIRLLEMQSTLPLDWRQPQPDMNILTIRPSSLVLQWNNSQLDTYLSR